MNEPPSSASSSTGQGPTREGAGESGYGASSAPPQVATPAGSAAAESDAAVEGTAPQGVDPSRSRLQEQTAEARGLQEVACAAVDAEVRKALRIAFLLVVPVVLLVVLTLVQAVTTDPSTALARESDWIEGHLALLLFLIAGQLVCALLVWEHWRTLEEIVTAQAQPAAGRLGRALAFAATILFVGLTLASGQLPIDSWWAVFWAGAAFELLALLIALASRRSMNRHTEGLTGAVAPELPEAPPGAAQVAPDEGELLAIGASGGGIRAAAFVLGGVNALQTTERYRSQEAEPEVFAVSGGSYTAAALALRRRFNPEDVPRQVGWRETFTVGSPETDYLRRHTRYLFEPASKLRDGAVSLLVGAVINLLLVGAVLRGLSWVSAQLAVTSGVVDLTGGSENEPATGLSVDVAEPLLIGVGLAGLAIAVASLGRWFIHRKFDQGADTDAADIRRMGVWAAVRATALAAVAGLLLLVAVPAATSALIGAVAHNSPSAMVAGALRSSGFGTMAMCEAALEERVTEAAEEAGRRARLSPGVERSVDTGACGATVTVSQTVLTQDDDDPTNDVVAPVAVEQARGLAGQVAAPIQVGTIVALLGTVVGLLTRGPAADAAREGRWFARLKRTLITWIPLVITGVIAVYLLLLWHLHFLLGVGTAGTAGFNAGVLVLAAVLAFFLDANATSMHQFYRERLSDAFAVGVDAGGTAAELPPERIYRFSDLAGGGPHLNVVTTLNTQAPHEVPTLRGGMPLVFGRRHVALHRTRGESTRVPTRAYESFAGPGRTSIMATVAMSGAAISPLMGRYADQMKPYRILLTLFNLRVGMWMLNPAQTMLIDGRPPGHQGLLAITARPGPAQVALEAVGTTGAEERWIYVSDGGHLDNTAMVECVRHAMRRTPAGQPLRGQVVILDASNDPPGAWSAVGDALNVIRADLGVDLIRKFTAGEPPWLRQFVELSPDGRPGTETFRVIVVKAVRVEPSAAASGTDWHRRLPEPVKSTQFLRPDFPRSSTAKQRFGDLEFEAYRAYGFAAVSEGLAFLDDPPTPNRVSRPFRSLTPGARGRLGS